MKIPHKYTIFTLNVLHVIFNLTYKIITLNILLSYTILMYYVVTLLNMYCKICYSFEKYYNK